MIAAVAHQHRQAVVTLALLRTVLASGDPHLIAGLAEGLIVGTAIETLSRPACSDQSPRKG